MTLREANLELVRIEGRGIGVRPIGSCIVDGKRYETPFAGKKDCEVYIPCDTLKNGCYMTVDETKKTWLVRLEKVSDMYYIDVWFIPEGANTDRITKINCMRKQTTMSAVL